MILLIRHAAHAHLGYVLSGRMPGIPLSKQGRSQADALATRLAGTAIDVMHVSPVQRAQETACAITAGRTDLDVDTVLALDEIDFGDWTGRTFAELSEDAAWHEWNRARASGVAPNGESMAETGTRAWRHVEATARAHPHATVAMVSHCDVIRALIVRILGLSLDDIHRFEIGPASVSRIAVGTWGSKVLSLNEVYA